MSNDDLFAEYQALRAANNELRLRGTAWLWDALDRLCTEITRELTAQPGRPSLQIGRQEWQFEVESSTMVGERFGARFQDRTLIVEAGWPELPQHGFVPDGGLARGRVGFSQNIMLDTQTVADLIYKKEGKGAPAWYVITNKKLGQQLTESHLRSYLKLLIN